MFTDEKLLFGMADTDWSENLDNHIVHQWQYICSFFAGESLMWKAHGSLNLSLSPKGALA